MSAAPPDMPMQRLLDRAEIQDALCRYARAVDRGDWALLRSTYHADAHDEHGDYQGDIDGLVAWLDARFAGVDNSMHLLGNCLIEFAGADLALVETYFVSRRLRAPKDDERHLAGAQDAMCREAWGRYVDRFERRDGVWRVADRMVVIEAASISVALGGARTSPLAWGRRDRGDPVYRAHEAMFGKAP